MSEEITSRRQLDIAPAGRWTINEFDGGKHYMLIADTASTQFSVHFDATQWDKFQELVSP